MTPIDGGVVAKIAATVISAAKKAFDFIRPPRVVKFIEHPRDSWWGQAQGQPDGHAVCQVSTHWYASNVSNSPARVLGAYIKPAGVRFLLSRWTKGNCVVRHPSQNLYGGFDIPPHRVSDASADFFIHHFAPESNKTLRVKLRFIDHLNVTHLVRIRLSPTPASSPSASTASVPRELLASIQDPTEKGIAAILQDEMSRYSKEGGRERGSLGSVATVQPNGAKTPGVPGDGWTLGRMEQHLLAPDANQCESNPTTRQPSLSYIER
jgi:hypothetical protein